MTERINRDRPAKNPGGMQCERCDEIFIGEEWHAFCAICVQKNADEIARARLLAVSSAYRKGET